MKHTMIQAIIFSLALHALIIGSFLGYLKFSEIAHKKEMEQQGWQAVGESDYVGTFFYIGPLDDRPMIALALGLFITLLLGMALYICAKWAFIKFRSLFVS